MGTPYQRGGSIAIDQHVVERLTAVGARFTAARRAVLEELLRSGGPRSAAEVHEDLRRSIPLSSLYRSLAVLEEAGVLIPHHGSRGVTRYEPAEWLSGHHHHLRCTDCGRVEDVAVSSSDERRMESLVGAIAGRAGFRPGAHTLEIEGLCDRCA
jgi:Fur family ferric uptake transcriptional regulator